MIRDLYQRVLSPFDLAIIRPEDANDVRLGKKIFIRFTFGGILIALTTILGGLIVGDYGGVTAAVVVGSFFTGFLIILRRGRRVELLFSMWVLVFLIFPFLLAVSYGGFRLNQFFQWGSFLPLLVVVLIAGRRASLLWYLVFAGLTIVAVLIDPLIANPQRLSPSYNVDLLTTSLTAGIVILLTVTYYKREKNAALELLARERERSEHLLLNILPAEVAETLKREPGIIAQGYDEASILYADIVGFTQLTSQMQPDEMVSLLNEIFSTFDSLVERHGAEKIRTIGDNYMVACGVPTEREDHAHALADLALAMQDYVRSLPPKDGTRIEFRIGINSGPLVAGVIGSKKFQYDLWGESVNLASRMESQGVTGKIQVTGSTCELIRDKYLLEERGVLEVKGMGQMETWFLIGQRV